MNHQRKYSHQCIIPILAQEDNINITFDDWPGTNWFQKNYMYMQAAFKTLSWKLLKCHKNNNTVLRVICKVHFSILIPIVQDDMAVFKEDKSGLLKLEPLIM